MVDFNKEKFIDVDFNEVGEDPKEEVLYYTPSQVCKILGIPDSTLRYYAVTFNESLDIKYSNNRRRYCESDIKTLKKFIRYREQGMTIAQIKKYSSDEVADEMRDKMIIKDNPLQIQLFMQSLTEEIENIISSKLECLEESVAEKLEDQLRQQKLQQEMLNESIHQQIAITVDEIVTEKLNNTLNEFKNTLAEKEDEAKQRDTEMIDMLRRGQEERAKEIKREEENKKGFFSKLFGK